ncbi:MAG: hypothetical protein EU529_06965 [Promethearchaeota archaeon]|nr:MAG: hypothetical protein EU529_06965 [Candidatus Lokiarchaeota archaeon]
MSYDDRGYDDEEEFDFSDSEKPDYSEYENVESFEFGENPQPDTYKYIGLKEFSFGESLQPEPHKYLGFKEFHFQKDSSLIAPQKNLVIPSKKGLERNLVRENEDEIVVFFNEHDNISPKEKKSLLTDQMKNTNINIPNFRERVKDYFDVISSINITEDQKKVIQSKSNSILAEFISRIEDNEFDISSTADPNVIAISIIYTAIISSEDMPEITMTHLATLGGIRTARITYYYNRYFRQLYPRIKFDPTIYKLTAIKKIFSMYFFQLFIGGDFDFSKQIQILRKKILDNNNLPDQLEEVNIRELQEIIVNYPNIFTKYFNDIFNIAKFLMELGRLYKIIGAPIKISIITKMLHKKGINLTQGIMGFRRSISEIYDFLKMNTIDFFPRRIEVTDTPKDQRPEKRRQIERIIGTRIKVYAAKNIYNGKYFEKGREGCEECLREGFKTDITRITALDFHHSTDNKEIQYTADNLYHLFINDELNPSFLEDLISLMESKRVVLLCSNHHNLLHHERYHDFKYLINYPNIFSYPADIIYLLVRIAVDNFYKTRHLNFDQKRNIRRNIRGKLRKKYFIDFFYEGVCPSCGRFNTRDHLTVFDFNHSGQHLTDTKIYYLFRDKSCSEILEVLVKERGGFLCRNCHRVFHFDKHIPLLEEIFEDRDIIKRIKADYNRVIKNYRILFMTTIGNPLKKSKTGYGKLRNYLRAISIMSDSGQEVTNSTLAKYMRLSVGAVDSYFRRNEDFVKRYIDIKVGRPRWEETTYSLNRDGEELLKLINHIRDYFSSIKG